jgi:hypothetical protein
MHPHLPHKLRLTCVDNDQAFVPAFVRQTAGVLSPTTVQVKSVLFCFEDMNQYIPQAIHKLVSMSSFWNFIC